MNMTVKDLVPSSDEFGSSDAWERVSETLGTPAEICQVVLSDFENKADRKDAIYKTPTGGPASSNEQDPLMEKIKVLVGPSNDSLYSSYEGDSDTSQSQVIKPVEEINITKEKKKNQSSEALQKQTVCTKFISLAAAKLELVALQKELLEAQLTEEKEKMEHNCLLRAMEIEDTRKRVEHNELLRTIELENAKLHFSNRVQA